MRIEKKLTAFFLLFCLMLSLFPLCAVAAENILGNSGFEDVTDGKATGWGLSGATVGNGFEVQEGDAAEGKRAVHFTHTGTNMYISSVGNVMGGTEYTFSAKLKTKGSFSNGPSIKLTWQKPDGKGSFETLDNKSISFLPKRSGAWETVTSTVSAPKDATRVILLVRLNEVGECWWDDVQILGEKGTGAQNAQNPDATPALTKPVDDAYPQAAASENQTVRMTKIDANTYNLLKNGNFETVAASGLPTGWNVSGGKVYSEAMTAAQDAAEGNNFLRFFGETTSIYAAQVVNDVIPGETYTFSAYVRILPGITGYTSLNVQCQKTAGNSFENIETKKQPLKTNEGAWEKVEYAFKAPEGTARFIVMLRLIGGGEAHWDDVKLLGAIRENAKLGIDFREMLAREAAESQRVEKTVGDKYAYDAPFRGQPENILQNGDFQKNNGKDFENWTLDAKFAEFGSVGENGGAARLAVKKEDGLKNPFYQQDVKIAGGAEYQITYRYKITDGEGAVPVIKAEYWSDRSLPGAGSSGGVHARAESYIYDGQWHEASVKIYPPENAAEMTVLARLLQYGEEDAEVFIDDVRICMTQPPSAMKLDTGLIFFYDDIEKGVFKAKANLSYFPELANATADFQLYRGSQIVWEKKDVKAEGGEAKTDFLTAVLSEYETPYCLKVTMYAPDGSTADVQTQNIFKYKRPTYLGADGVYMKNGKEPFYPIYAYHVQPKDYKKAAAGGVNLVQMGAFSTVEAAVERLDAAKEAGIMGFIALYYGMKPAGDESNIDRTISILSDPRVQNHPALFGYGVMDEVFLQLSNPHQVMENSYRLIRSLDKNRPIMTMEAMSNYYAETSKFVDILCIDPYSAAHVKSASTRSDIAREAVDYKKPVYALLEAYYTTHGRWPTPEDGRNNNWQALIAGATCVGYYSISDSDVGANGEDVPIWDARDGGALWNALSTFGTEEKELAYGHFVRNESPAFCEARLDDYWYSAWILDGNVYMIVLGMKEGQEKAVSIPLESFKGDIKLGEFTAEIVQGRTDKTPISGSGSLDLTIHGIEAVLFKITPKEAMDFSKLGATAFEDLENHNWARQQIARLAARGIVDGRSAWEYAPGENITRAELAAFLVRTLGLSADTSEGFADVGENHPYAKEIAIGKACGVLNGVGENRFNPEAYITRQDMMTIISRGMQLSGSTQLSAFSDADRIAEYAKVHVSAMVASGLIRGNADGTINPTGNTTRAEAAVIMDRILG